jgi:DNA-directed RNA polymerase
MNPIKQKLIEITTERIASELAPQNPVKFIKDLPCESLIDDAISTLYLFTKTKKGEEKGPTPMSEIVAEIGRQVRRKAELPKNSAIAAKTGGFLLYSFEQLEIVKVKLSRASNGHNGYFVEVLNVEALAELWTTVPLTRTEKLPSLVPYAPWTGYIHETGVKLAKTQDISVRREMTPGNMPLVFDCVNRAQLIGWQIHSEIYSIYTWALRNKTDAFAEVWEMQNPEAKMSKLREVRAVGSIANRLLGETFYHLYYYDFRCRKYPMTAYLHEQGTDVAKGLLLKAKAQPLTKDGYDWLLIVLASNWGGDAGRVDGQKTDKIPLVDRILWAKDNKELILSFAESPKVNQGWMKADKPWQFLAACIEFRKFEEWRLQVAPDENATDYSEELLYSYETQLVGYIDGSNNGAQHLAALTKDEVTAPHVNLVPSALPGDLYKYVADHVWNEILKEKNKLSDAEVEECERLIATLFDTRKQLKEAVPKSDRRRELSESMHEFRGKSLPLIRKAAPVFWGKITDSKSKRKIAKRNVMTLPYGGSAYGLGQQQIDDARKHGVELLAYMENRWGSYMGQMIYSSCRESMLKPMQLLKAFEDAGKKQEQLGITESKALAAKLMEENGGIADSSEKAQRAIADAKMKFLAWRLPVTNFLVVQRYTEGTTKKVYVQYGPPKGERATNAHYENTYQLAICFTEIHKASVGKQSLGASPNAIHSLDAAHLVMTVCACPFDVVTIHDSFGASLGDLPALYRIVREQFVELYRHDPLTSIMNDIGGDISHIQMGTLDLNLVLESEFAFV